MNHYKPNWVSEKKFEIKEEHIKLLKRSVVNWNETGVGAPTIDPVQPYGSTCIHCDIAKIIGLKPRYSNTGGNVKVRFEKDQIEYMEKLHKEMKVVLQILLSVGSVSVGHYECELFNQWRKNDL